MTVPARSAAVIEPVKEAEPDVETATDPASALAVALVRFPWRDFLPPTFITSLTIIFR